MIKISGIFDFIPFIGKGAVGAGVNWGFIFLWTLIIMGICMLSLFLFFFILIRKRLTRVYEIDHKTKRIRKFFGRIKKSGDKVEMFIARKIRKPLPKPQQKDFYVSGRKDVLFLIKDNNSIYHTLGLPTWKQLQTFYDGAYHKDITTSDPIPYDVFILPNIYENIKWLLSQYTLTEKKISDLKWWQHPSIMIIATVGFLSLMFMVYIIVVTE